MEKWTILNNLVEKKHKYILKLIEKMQQEVEADMQNLYQMKLI